MLSVKKNDMNAGTQTDKFSLVAREFLNAGDRLQLPVHQNWPEFLKWENGWVRTAAEGFNVFALMRAAGSKNYKSPFWLALREGEKAGGKLREGATGINVAMWRWSLKHEGWEGDISPGNISAIQDSIENIEESEKAVAMRPTVVFNAQEWDGIDSPAFRDRTAPSKEEALERAQKVEKLGAGCEIRHEGTIAYYNPALNYICVPSLNQVGAHAYYWMLFEQIGHAVSGRHQANVWSGQAELTLAKDPRARVTYAKMLAAILAYETGIDVLE